MTSHTNSFNAIFDNQTTILLQDRCLTFEIDAEYNYSQDSYIIGATYVLPGIKCDWGHMPGKEYILKYVFKELSGVDVDLVIMKQISGKQGTIFCLSKVDCENMGIPYEDGLQVFHKDMNFKFKRGQNIKINWKDLSTYPVSKKTLRIGNIHLLCHIKEPYDSQKHLLHVISNDNNNGGVNATSKTKCITRYAPDMYTCLTQRTTEVVDISLGTLYEKEELMSKGILDLVSFTYHLKDDPNEKIREMVNELGKKYISNDSTFSYRTQSIKTQSRIKYERAQHSIDETFERVDKTMQSVEDTINRVTSTIDSFNKRDFSELF